MINRHLNLTLILLLAGQFLTAQNNFDFSTEAVKSRLHNDVYKLASEEMEGREAGTPGERKAAEFIINQMKEMGLQPMFGDSYLQPFEFFGERSLGPDNFLIINNRQFKVDEEVFVLPNTANKNITSQAVYVGFGMERPEHNDYKELTNLDGKIFIMEMFLPDVLEDNARSQRPEVMYEKIETAVKKGASAIIFVNTASWRNDPNTRLNQSLDLAEIPIMFARKEVFNFWKETAVEKLVFLSTDIARETFTAVNVAGYWNNNAENTIVIGGHFDHLGYGGSGSRSPNTQAIHYGADDNASGMAGVLEAARYLSNTDLTSNNYIFIGFSAEEKGLLGSRYFTNSDAYDMGKVNYMLNFDMIGRVDNRKITLIGTGTSPLWESTIDSWESEALDIQKSPGGVGGSDHTHFYLKNIPVLFFFSGIHDDYHKPSDTPDKVNFDGMIDVLSLAYYLLEEMDGQDKLVFSSTPVTSRGRARTEGVTLGLMPDFGWSGEGLKVQAVIQERPAQKSGIKDGDVIIQIGTLRVRDMDSYMNALSSLQPNQKVIVKVLRDSKEIEVEVTL
jgi:aminopeptidase YwaD